MNKLELGYELLKDIAETGQGKSIISGATKLFEETFPRATNEIKSAIDTTIGAPGTGAPPMRLSAAGSRTALEAVKPTILKLTNDEGELFNRSPADFVAGKPGERSTYEFKTSDNIPLFRYPEPRRLQLNPSFRTKGGKASYETLDDNTINLRVPSLQDLTHAPTEELKKLLALNQQQLLHGLEAINPDEFPKLGFHGTDNLGADFLWNKKASFSRPLGVEDGLWIRTQAFESNAPQVFLNDMQHSIAFASHTIPYGHSSLDSEGVALRHQIVVVDASKEIWNWDKAIGKYKQSLTREAEPPVKGESGWNLDAYIGDQVSHLGKTQVDINPENFNELVLGSFENTGRNLSVDIPRNYFDKWKYERQHVINALQIQEDTASAFDLAGIIRRKS